VLRERCHALHSNVWGAASKRRGFQMWNVYSTVLKNCSFRLYCWLHGTEYFLRRLHIKVVNKFPVFYGIWRFVFARDCYWIISWARWIQCRPSYISVTFILILSFHVHRSPSHLVSLGFHTKIALYSIKAIYIAWNGSTSGPTPWLLAYYYYYYYYYYYWYSCAQKAKKRISYFQREQCTET
jgi:hypothetical protein